MVTTFFTLACFFLTAASALPYGGYGGYGGGYGGYGGAPPTPVIAPPTYMPHDGSHCIGRWQQCGGAGFPKLRACCGYNVCEPLTEYYWQCNPHVPAGVIAQYEDCDIKNDKCEPLTKCMRIPGDVVFFLCKAPTNKYD